MALVDTALSRLTFHDIMEPLMPYDRPAGLHYASFAPILPEFPGERRATLEYHLKGFIVASVRFAGIVGKLDSSKLSPNSRECRRTCA